MRRVVNTSLAVLNCTQQSTCTRLHFDMCVHRGYQHMITLQVYLFRMIIAMLTMLWYSIIISTFVSPHAIFVFPRNYSAACLPYLSLTWKLRGRGRGRLVPALHALRFILPRTRAVLVLHTQECWFFPAVIALLASESGL